jgi:uncharacterized SAM-binding protein YcdF (DUF218 family)
VGCPSFAERATARLKSGSTNRGLRRIVFLLIVLAGVLILWQPVLRGIGSLLVNVGPPVKADAILVLAGDGSGRRILVAAELARKGYAPVVIADSSLSYYGSEESDLAAEFAVRHGYSPALFISPHWTTSSTVAEAGLAIGELRKRGFHKVLIVTTLWHTARAGRIFRRMAPDLETHMIGAGDPVWHNGNWWMEREGQKTFVLEASKTIADFLRF